MLTDPEDEVAADAGDRLVHLHLNMARMLAHRYRNRGVEVEDLEQVACLELVAVSRSYHPRKGESFLAYAVPCIRGAVRRHFRDRGWTARPPRRTEETQYAVRRAAEELHQLLGRSPRPSEVAAHLQVPVEEVREALSLGGCFTPASLDRPLEADGSDSAATLLDLVPTARDDFVAADARALLAPAIRRLSEKDREIRRLRFCKQRTQKEIAASIGVTQMQVSRLLTRILRDLRGGLEQPPGPVPSAVRTVAGPRARRGVSGRRSGSRVQRDHPAREPIAAGAER